MPHTTAGVTINEDADPSVRADLEMALERLVPRDLPFTHLEGNSDAHTKASLMGSSVTVPVVAGALQLGTWQGIYFAEFDGPAAAARPRDVPAGLSGRRCRQRPEHLLEQVPQRVGVEPAAAVPQQQPLGGQVLAVAPRAPSASRPASRDAYQSMPKFSCSMRRSAPSSIQARR